MENITLSFIIRTVAKYKKLFIVNAIIALALSIAVALSVPPVYESSSSLASETKEEGSLGNMSSLASLAGVNLSASNDAIVPELYPSVVVTNEFLVNLLKTKVCPGGGKKEVTYLDFLQNYSKEPWWTKAMGGIVKIFSKKENKGFNAKAINPEQLSKQEDALVEGLKGQVLCTLDKSEGVINIKVFSQDAYVSKQLVETVTKQLQTFITDYRTSKSRVDLAYYQRLKKEAYDRYMKAQRKYAVYSDSHMDLSLKSYQLESDALENDLQLAYNTYSQACQQETMAEAKVQERTPAFTVVEKATVAPYPSSPKKKLIVVAYLFVFMAGTLCYALLREVFSRKKKKAMAAKVAIEREKIEDNGK